MRRVRFLLFKRNKYVASASGKTYLPKDRLKAAEAMGAATSVTVHGRIYARDSGISVDFDAVQGCFGDELPLEGPRAFTLAKSGTSPALPWDGTSMATLPDDGSFAVSPTMSLAELQLKVTGTGSVELEMWGTAHYDT